LNSDNVLNAKTSFSIFKGSYIKYRVLIDKDKELVIFRPYRPDEEVYNSGDEVKIGWFKEAGIILLD